MTSLSIYGKDSIYRITDKNVLYVHRLIVKEMKSRGIEHKENNSLDKISKKDKGEK